MNTNNDELEQMLAQQLHHQVDGMDDHPLGFGDVKGRAGRIRRNRRLAAGAAVAAAVAIITPVAMLAGQGLDAADRELPPAGPSPVEMARKTLTLDGLERGDAPGVEYFTPDGVVLPGEGLQPLDGSYQAMVPSEAVNGWIAMGPSADEVLYLDQDFAPRDGSFSSTSLVSSPDRGWAAWSDVEPGATTLSSRSTTDPDAGTDWSFPGSSAVDAVGFLAPDRVIYDALTLEGGHDLGIAEPDGSKTPLGDFASVSSASPETGLIAVDTRLNKDNTVCSGVVDPDVSTTEPVWETCDYRLGSFSPDGRHVMASSPYGDGFGLTEIEVLDSRTGDVVARFTQASNTQIALVQPVWESDDAIVSVAAEDEKQTIVRLGVDGTLEEAVEPTRKVYGDLYFYMSSDRTTL